MGAGERGAVVRQDRLRAATGARRNGVQAPVGIDERGGIDAVRAAAAAASRQRARDPPLKRRAQSFPRRMDSHARLRCLELRDRSRTRRHALPFRRLCFVPLRRHGCRRPACALCDPPAGVRARDGGRRELSRAARDLTSSQPRLPTR